MELRKDIRVYTETIIRDNRGYFSVSGDNSRDYLIDNCENLSNGFRDFLEWEEYPSDKISSEDKDKVRNYLRTFEQ